MHIFPRLVFTAIAILSAFTQAAHAQQCRTAHAVPEGDTGVVTDPFLTWRQLRPSAKLAETFIAGKQADYTRPSKNSRYGNYAIYMPRIRRTLDGLGLDSSQFRYPNWVPPNYGEEYMAYRLERLTDEIGTQHPYVDHWLASRAIVTRQCRARDTRFLSLPMPPDEALTLDHPDQFA